MSVLKIDLSCLVSMRKALFAIITLLKESNFDYYTVELAIHVAYEDARKVDEKELIMELPSTVGSGLVINKIVRSLNSKNVPKEQILALLSIVYDR